MNSGVPTMLPATVSPAVNWRVTATPKSARAGWPAASKRTLAGLMSRWTTALAVRRGQGVEQRPADRRDLRRGQRALGADPVGQAGDHAGHHQHHVGPVVLDGEQRDDAGVVEAGQDLGLPANAPPGHVDLLGRAAEEHPFAGQMATLFVDRQLDHRHAAPA